MTIAPTTRPSLLLRLRDPGDHDAWVEFVSLYEPVIYRVLRRTGLQDADALEVLQDLFLAVNRNIERWQVGEEHGSFRGWLRRVTRNLVVSWVRRQRRQLATMPIDLDALLDSTSTEDCPATDEFDHELRRALFHRASEQVRAEVRPLTWQAFWNVAVSGISVAETASKLGMTPGAVRVAKCRIVSRLSVVVAEMEKSA
ncbi:MAG: sigma-70 family RNA polymerase sigma factor [Planctomycetota bacterium]